mmetsp:Transcript_93910/g.249323  ORF Transcript_93910/g.249323 Transcript_93910/m.249323 type:complete len:224 (-) Transcript_93910:427-1098(-)
MPRPVPVITPRTGSTCMCTCPGRSQACRRSTGATACMCRVPTTQASPRPSCWSSTAGVRTAPSTTATTTLAASPRGRALWSSTRSGWTTAAPTTATSSPPGTAPVRLPPPTPRCHATFPFRSTTTATTAAKPKGAAATLATGLLATTTSASSRSSSILSRTSSASTARASLRTGARMVQCLCTSWPRSFRECLLAPSPAAAASRTLVGRTACPPGARRSLWQP